MKLAVGLGAESVQFLLVGFRLAGSHVVFKARRARNGRFFFWLNEELEVGFARGVIADFGQEKRIDASGRGNQMEVASNPRLRGMYVAEVVYTVDDPELFVA